jgi:hypothetical protein
MSGSRRPRKRQKGDDISKQPTLPVPSPSGRYRWVIDANERTTVPPPSSDEERAVKGTFEPTKTLRRPLK